MINRNRKNAIVLEDLSGEDGRLLVNIAVETMRNHIKGDHRTSPGICEGKFQKYAGVFVTIKKQGSLRGCIGFPYPVYSLCEAVINASVAAATDDPRFMPVTESELDDLEVEVTVLGFPEEIDQLSDDFDTSISIGLHGLIVTREFNSGLLLPQVAVEESFSPVQFLAQTCIKAGLSPSAWKDRETKVFRFEGRIFQRASTSSAGIKGQ